MYCVLCCGACCILQAHCVGLCVSLLCVFMCFIIDVCDCCVGSCLCCACVLHGNVFVSQCIYICLCCACFVFCVYCFALPGGILVAVLFV